MRERMDVAILMHDGAELLDFAGPGEVFAAARYMEYDRWDPEDGLVVSQGS